MILLENFLFLLLEMAPFLLFGFLFSGILSVMLTVETVAKYLGSNRPFSVFLASLFGIPLPLCSCGVIPVFSYLKKHGATKGAATSFLISTPQTGVDSIAVTYRMLGPIFAIIRPLVALVSGIVGGLLVNYFDKEETLKEQEDHCHDDCCDDKSHGVIYRIFNYGFVKLAEDIGPTLLVGLGLASIISAFITPDHFYLVNTGIVGMLTMLLLGIPLYVCATASVPLALSLHLSGGFSMGTLIVFLMAGPATNMATISVAYKQLGKKSTFIYIGSIVICSIVAGLFFDQIFPDFSLSEQMGGMFMIPLWLQELSAILLILILLNVYRLKYFTNNKIKEVASAQSLYVSGMTCNHCVDSIKKTLQKIKGLSDITIDLSSGRVQFVNNGADLSFIKQEIIELGFEIKKDD